MSINFEEIKETLEVNRDSIINDRELTDEYIVDDLMLALGYNKKRDANVKKVRDGQIDWEVLDDGKIKLAVKVFSISDGEEPDELSSTLKFCADKRIKVVLVTNGEKITIYRYDKYKAEYAKVTVINITVELSETDNLILKAISKNEFNTDIIDEAMKPKLPTADEIKEELNKHIDDIVNQLATWYDNNSEDAISHFKNMLIDLGNEKTVVENNSLEPQVDNTKIEELERELVESNNKNRELEVSIDELNKTIESLKENIDNTSENNTAVVDNETVYKLEEANKELADVNEKLDKANTKINELSDKIEEQLNTISEQNNKIEELEKKSEETSLKDDSGSSEEINSLKAEIAEKDKEISKLKNLSENSGKSDSDLMADISAYREQIEDLTIKLSTANEEIDKLNIELKKAQDEINDMAGADRKKAQELLDVIEDNPELERNYVAVINTELIQYNNINTFVGRSLQKLYEIKNFEASQYIFDGSLFTLEQPAKRNDLMMNNKNYDVNLHGQHEDAALNLLRITFSHFDDVIFECKKIGTLKDGQNESNKVELTKESVVDTDDAINIIGEETVDSEDNFSNTFDDEVITNGGSTESFESFSNEDENSTEIFEENNENFESDSNNYGFDEQQTTEFVSDTESLEGFDDEEFIEEGSAEGESNFDDEEFVEEEQLEGFDDEEFVEEEQLEGFDDDEEFVEEETVDNEDNFFVCQLLQIDGFINHPDLDRIDTIKYIGTNDANFNINMSESEISNEKLLSKCVDAVLAIEVGRGNNGIIQTIKQKELSLLGTSIHEITADTRNCPKINGTKFVITDIEDVKDVVSLLHNLCLELNIDMSDIFVYFSGSKKLDATTDSFDECYAYPESSVVLMDNMNYSMNENDVKHSVGIIRGDMLSSIIVTKKSLQVHKEIFEKCAVVKTRYMKKDIMDDSDVPAVIQDLITEAYSQNRDINFDAFGNLVGTNYKLVSYNPEEVLNGVEIDTGNGVAYVSSIEQWQIPHALVKIHVTLFGDTAIAIKCKVNQSAINFYGLEFITSDPSLTLSIKSFVTYVASCIKK